MFLNLHHLKKQLLFCFIDALLSDLSYSQSEDGSYDIVVEKSKPVYAQIKKRSASNIPDDLNTKRCEVFN